MEVRNLMPSLLNNDITNYTMQYMMPTEPTPLTSKVTFTFPIGDVKESIQYLLRVFPQYFIAKKNGINDELGTFVFDRPKGVDTPTIRLTLSAVDEKSTNVEIHCSSSSFTSTPPDLQVAITEVQNILMAKLNGKSDEAIKEVIKMNNSGNGVWGCLKTIWCIVIVVIMILVLLAGVLSLFIN